MKPIPINDEAAFEGNAAREAEWYRRDMARGAVSARELPAAGPVSEQETVLIYRDRLGVPSEVHFLRRLYAGFTRLVPIWIGCRLDREVESLAAPWLTLGREGLAGRFDRALFKHLGIMPKVPDLAGLRPRLVHAHFGRGGALALPLAKQLGVPLVVTFHGGDATKEKHYRRGLVPTIFQRRMAELLDQSALIHCVSNHIRVTLEKRGFPREKLLVIPYGVEPDQEPPCGLLPSEPYVLFVGRFVEKKGVTNLIEAMRLLQDQGEALELILVGDGELADQLRKQARCLERVKFLGWLPNGEVRRWMRGAVAVCVPSVTAASGDAEGLPNVVLEAMAAGTPVIGSQHSGIAEIIDHGRTGLLVSPGDPEQLAEAILTLHSDPQVRTWIGTAGRQRVTTRFGAAAQSRALEDALLSVLEPRRAIRPSRIELPGQTQPRVN